MNQKGNWLATQTRPDFSCQVSQSQQMMPTPTVGQIRYANAFVHRAQQHADLTITFRPIPLEHFRLVIHTDYSSKDMGGTGRTQGGYILGATDAGMAQGKISPWVPLVW